MEIILKETIETLGQEGEIVKVKPGYARNFLVPSQKAVLVNKASRHPSRGLFVPGNAMAKRTSKSPAKAATAKGATAKKVTAGAPDLSKALAAAPAAAAAWQNLTPIARRQPIINPDS